MRKMPKKKYTQEQKEKAIARLTLGERPTKIAKSLNIPYSTIAYWKANLKKVKKQNGTLGYHFEERKNFVNKAWKSIRILLNKIENALNDVEIKTPKDIRDLTVILGIIYDKQEKATPQPKLSSGKKTPLIDLSKVPTAELEIIIAKVKQIGETTPPQLEEGEVIKGEAREI